MKKKLLFVFGLLLTIGANAQTDPVVMEIDGKPVTKSEFLQIYLKNNSAPQYDKASLDEYMELFKKFKLKVAEAEVLGYDIIPKLKKELEGYKKQLAHPYLVDAAKNEELVKQAYDRTVNEIRASHILIKLDPNAAPADTLAAWDKIMGLKKRIEKGEDFASVAKGRNGSEDPSALSNGGDLGFFNAFQMVYPFEEAAYTTPMGTVSEPFRTRFGYHIVKVTDKRPARGTMRAAHIMVATSKSATEEDVKNAEKKINEIYAKLQAGAKFEDLVKDFSDDPSSNQKGGELPAFGSGTTTRMVPAFEDAAFALTANGEYLTPESDTVITKLALIVLTNDNSVEPESFIDSRNFPYLTAEGNFPLPQQNFEWVFQATPDGFSSLFFSMKLFDLRFGETIVIYPQKDNSFFYQQVNESPNNYATFTDYTDKIKEHLLQSRQ